MFRKLLVAVTLVTFIFVGANSLNAQITDVKDGVKKGIAKTNQGAHKGWRIGKKASLWSWHKGKKVTKAIVKSVKS